MKRVDMLDYTSAECNYLESLAKTFIVPARQNQFNQRNIFDNAPVRRIATAMNANSAFTGWNIENPFWYQQFDLIHVRILRGGQSTVDFDAADKCRLYVTTMKAKNFQDDIPSLPIDFFSKTTMYCAGFDFDARCHWKLSLPSTNWRTTGAGAKLYFSPRPRYWTHCIGRTKVCGCSW